jgi:glycosyltransferase involved in cell wall biosynthesis
MQAIAGNLTLRRILSWARRKNIKIIIWVCGWEPDRVKGLFLKLKNLFVSSFLKKSDYFLTYSTKASRYVKTMGINESIIETCYNGIEIDDMVMNVNEILGKSLGIRKELFLVGFVTFLYVGGFHKEKRLDLLIEAFSELRKKYGNLKLLIIGDGPLRGEVEGLLKKQSDPNMRYLGRIIDEVDAYFAAADCLVLPGVGGLALNQAMFWKKLCIVSEADGTEDDLVIEGYSGYRFTKGDLGSFITCIERRINENPDKLVEMSENAHRLIVEKSNVSNMVKCFSNAMDKLVF